MRAMLRGRLAARTAWAAVALAALLAISAHWLRQFRLTPPDRAAKLVFTVTTAADAGPGSLREGIFAADRAPGRARVVMGAHTVRLQTPLPPLVNPAGVVLEGDGAVLDARLLAGGPVLDVAAPASVISGLRIEGAREQAILLRQAGTHLRGVTVVDGNVGVYQLESASDLTIEDAAFERNSVGVHVTAASGRTALYNNRFRGHRRAAIWAVTQNPRRPRPGHVEVVRNHFNGDSQPLVAFNLEAIVERNAFEGASGPAVYVNGNRAAIRQNRMRSGRTFGIYADRIDHGSIVDNELDHNCAGGMIVRNSRSTQISSNRVYANGYGIILVEGQAASPNTVSDNLVAQHTEDGLHVIGASPIVRRNHLLQNRKAGFRVSALTAAAPGTRPTPLLDANVLHGNGINDVHHDDYVPRTGGVVPAEPADCAWRVSSEPVQVAAAGARN